MIRREDDGIWIVLRETITTHHEDVFACLTTGDGLSRWFPVAAEVDLRVGGQIVFCWDEQCTKTSTVAILDYDPGGRVTWDWYAGSGETHAPVYWAVIPNTEKGAMVVMRQGPFKSDEESMVGMAEEAESWRWQLCNLRTVLEVKHDMRAIRPL